MSTVKNMLKTLLPLLTFLGSLWGVTLTARTTADSPPYGTATEKESLLFLTFLTKQASLGQLMTTTGVMLDRAAPQATPRAPLYPTVPDTFIHHGRHQINQS